MLENDIGQINAALAKIDSEIINLQHKRSLLRSKLNDHLSATRGLPNEVLSEIFRLSTNRLDLREPQLYYVDLKSILKVGSVCALWRRVVWSTPHLWTTSLLTRAKANIPPFLISLSLSNSQNSTVSVEINLDYLPLEYMKIFVDHHSQIGSLMVYYTRMEPSMDIWNRLSTYFPPSSDHWPKLKELWLCGGEEKFTPSSLLLQTPNSDAFHYTRQENECVPWHIPVNQLTILRLLHIPIDQCLYLLVHCPNLVEYHCVNPGYPSDIYEQSTIIPTSHRPKPFPTIKTLRWRALGSKHWNTFFFSSFRFPYLERLHWGGSSLDLISSHPSSPPAMRPLSNNFLPSLGGNKLIALDWESRHRPFTSYVPLFAHTNTNFLHRLYITSSTSQNLINWLESLTLTSSATNHFPNLRIFHAKVRNIELGEWRVFNAVKNFLCSRRSHPQQLSSEGTHCWNDSPSQEYWRNHIPFERFILDTDEVPLRLEQEQMNALKALVAGGLAIQFVLPELKHQVRTTLG